MTNYYFTHTVFSTIRAELGTLGSIQQLFHAHGMTDDTEALELLFSVADIHCLRALELMPDTEVYFFCKNLIEGYKDGKAIKQEMEVEPSN